MCIWAFISFCVRHLELLPLLLVRGRGGSGGTSCPVQAGQRSARGCGCTLVLLGANILTHSSVSVVGAVPQHAPDLEFFTELFLIRDYHLTSLYSGEAGIAWHTWCKAHCPAVAAGVVPSTHSTKLAPKGINDGVVLKPFHGHNSDKV